MSNKGLRCIIECHCILPQYRSRPSPVYHKFVVFLEIDESDTVITKYVQCNNCGVVHKVYDVCKSEIMVGKEELYTVATVEDCKLSLTQDVQMVLESYDVELSTWENVKFIVENEKKDDFVVLKQEEIDDGTIQGKLMRYSGEGKFKIENFTRSTNVG